MTALEFEHVTRVHGAGDTAVVALDNVTFSVHPGELVAVTGPSGAGKSTLLHLAGGLDSPSSGRVIVAGTDLGQLSQRRLAAVRRRSIGYVFQETNLLPALSVIENVSLPLELDGVTTSVAKDLAFAALASVQVDDLADRFPEDLSGGQRQRVAIARGLIGEPRLLLADEPTGALDTPTGDSIVRLLRERCDQGATGLLVSHEPRYAAWANRVIYLRDGCVVDETTAPAMTARGSA
jgi:putative ABC transport system ATP-binding protein